MFLLVLLGEWLCGSSKLLSFLFHFVEGSETGEEGNEIGAFARFACVCISHLHNRRFGGGGLCVTPLDSLQIPAQVKQEANISPLHLASR